MKKKLTPEEKQKKADLRAEARYLIAKGLHEDKTELKEFLENVIPHRGMDYYLYLVDSEKTNVNMRFDRADYINALCCLSQYNHDNLFFHPASFDGWKKNINAVSVNCLYVDIDDINFYADENDKESTLRFLKERYNFSEDIFDYAILSGRGIHLVALIEPLYFHSKTIQITKGRKKYNIANKFPCPHSDCKNRELCENSETCINIDIFKRYTMSLAEAFEADLSTESVNHMYRCPTSANNKDREIKGKIFKLNDLTNRDIQRLDVFLKSDEELKAYRDKHFAEAAKKREETQLKNQQKKKDFLASLGDEPIEHFIERSDISEEDRNFALKIFNKMQQEELKSQNKKAFIDIIINEIDFYDDKKALPYKHLKPYTNYKPQNRNWNLLLDLHNLFISRQGRLISRNMFFFIISNYLKMMDFSSFYAIKYCRRYVDRYYYDEMEATVNATYNNETTYYFTYDYIAKVLCMSDEEINNCYCNFSPERRKEAKKLNNHRYYEKKKAEKGISPAKLKRASELEYIKENPDMKWQEATEHLGISRSKFFTLRKELGLSVA